MSFFYINPPKGLIPLEVLETIVSIRLKCLDSIYRNRLVDYNEYMIEGSIYDSVGHFSLCTLAIVYGEAEVISFIINAERALFEHRLKTISVYNMQCLAKKILRCIKKTNIVFRYADPLYKLCLHLSKEHLAYHITCNCSNSCNSYEFSVNFKYCLKFVASRQVTLKLSLASLPCSLWKEYLVLLFCEFLRNRITHNTRQILTLKDDLLEIFRSKFSYLRDSSSNSTTKVIKCHEVDYIYNFFPPCMLNLHQNLRNRHRLSHNQRFYYSLFLKDIGMPVEEAIKFWRAEYSREPNGSHACCHNWESDEKKYLYDIRHTYGLEGGKKNYMSKNCQFIQNCGNCFSEGGCPFKSFDNKNLQQILKLKEDTNFNRIYDYKVKRSTLEHVYFILIVDFIYVMIIILLLIRFLILLHITKRPQISR